MKEYAKDFYKGKQWRNISRLYMERKHYICERCGAVAKICHHKKYITAANINDPAVTLNFDNLEALCQECHNKEHFRKHNTAIFDDSGNLTGVKESAALEDYRKAVEELERRKDIYTAASTRTPVRFDAEHQTYEAVESP